MLRWKKGSSQWTSEKKIPGIGTLYAEINLDEDNNLYNLEMESMEDQGSGFDFSIDEIKSLDEAKRMAEFKIQRYLISQINKMLNYMERSYS